MTKKILRWLLLSLLGIILIALLYLGITGFPKPPAMERAENVPRLPWSFYKNNLNELLLSLKVVTFRDWHPDGEKMVVNAHGGGMRFYPHALDEPMGEPEIFPNYPKKARGFRFNPNPEKGYLVFSMDTDGDENYQLYHYDLAAGAYTRITPAEGKNGLGQFSQDGDWMAYTSTRRNGKDYDIYLIDPERPETDTLLIEREGFWGVQEWSPTQDSLLVGQYVSVNESYPYLLDVPARTLIPLFDSLEEKVAYGSSTWAPDGKHIYYSSDRETEFKHLRILDLETREERILSEEIPWDVGALELSADGKTLSFTANVEGETRLFLMDTGTEEIRPFELEGLPPGQTGSLHFHPTKNLVAINHVPYGGMPAAFTYDLNTGELTQWTKRKEMETQLPPPKLIHYPTFDSVSGEPRMISAWYLEAAPAAPGPHAVYISIHGGPEGQSGPPNDPIIDKGRESGIAYLYPNVRGSTGYGKTFTKLDNGFLRENSVRDIGALLDWIATQPDLDKDRVMVAGGSYGGYMTLACLTHYSDRLVGGIDVVGISHFVTFLENTESYRRDLRRVEYGDERIPEMRSFLDSISPLNQVEKITQPLMIFQGKNDPRVPVTESRQMVEKMAEAGLEVWYLEAADEGHGIRNPWNRLYYEGTKHLFAKKVLNIP